MMRLIGLFCLAWALAPVSAFSAVQVKSGEHVDFSRVVLYFDDAIEWELGRVEDGYLLRTAGAAQDYDLSTLFDFMPRSRVLEAREAPAGLVFSVECECHADAFEYRPGILVLDFKDGARRANSAFEKGFAADELSGPDLASVDAGQEVENADRPGRARTDTEAADQQSFVSGKRHEILDPGIALPAATLPSVRGIALRENLVRALGRAMTQGVVAAPPSAAEQALAAIDLDAARRGEQIRYHTATDLLQQDLGEAEGKASEKLECLPSEYFALSDWGSEPIEPDFLGSLRSELAAATEQPSQASILSALQAHLYLGFGAEALQILESFPLQGEEGEVFAAMAQQMDKPGRSSSPLLASQAECGDGGALWGILALDLSKPLPPINADAVFHTVSSLPLHLRGYLAPAVSERLRALDRADMATAVRASVSRAAVPKSDEMILEVAHAEPEQARTESLREISRKHSTTALEAQSGLLTDHLEDLDLRRAENRHEIEAQIHVAKGSPEGANLFRAYISALAAAGQYEAAIDYNFYLSRSRKADALNAEEVYHDLMAQVTEDGSDGNFILAVAERGPDGHPFPIPQELALAIAERLDRLGFAGPAAAYGARALSEDERRSEESATRHNAEVSHGMPSDAPRIHDGETGAHIAESRMSDAEDAPVQAQTSAAPQARSAGGVEAVTRADAGAGRPAPRSEAAAERLTVRAAAGTDRTSASIAAEARGDSGGQGVAFGGALTLAAQEALLADAAAFRQRAAEALGSD